MHLDETDRRLLRLLAQDGRASFAALGLEVGLSTSAVKRRVDRLVEIGVIRGFAALIDDELLGYGTDAITTVRFSGTTPPAAAISALRDNPSVISAWTVTGQADLVLHLRVRDTRGLQEAINSLRQQEAIVSTQTMVIMATLVDGPRTQA